MNSAVPSSSPVPEAGVRGLQRDFLRKREQLLLPGPDSKFLQSSVTKYQTWQWLAVIHPAACNYLRLLSEDQLCSTGVCNLLPLHPAEGSNGALQWVRQQLPFLLELLKRPFVLKYSLFPAKIKAQWGKQDTRNPARAATDHNLALSQRGS